MSTSPPRPDIGRVDVGSPNVGRLRPESRSGVGTGSMICAPLVCASPVAGRGRYRLSSAVRLGIGERDTAAGIPGHAGEHLGSPPTVSHDPPAFVPGEGDSTATVRG